MSTKLDVLFINPGNQTTIYQDLAKDYSAIETPTWAFAFSSVCAGSGVQTRNL